ncbi:MAG: amidase [Negativicutes bacterium]|nr:amidase [Negativicutes bacterium]
MEILKLTLKELRSALDEGKITTSELVHFYLDRVAKLNHEGANINAILELNPELELLAQAKDHERKIGKAKGALHGIPVLVKDNIDTFDMMHTSAGSLALKNHYASKDAFVAHKLKEAGAIIFGKANMTEWANFMTRNMRNGYSSRGGQVLNPYGPNVFDVSGSSAGSAAGVASRMVPVAVGTETSGSVLSPANMNSLVGIKPTVGLVSRTGIIPIMFSQDTAGPLAICVEDAAYLLNSMIGIDENDSATLSAEGHFESDYTKFINPTGLQGKRLGFVTQMNERLTPEKLEVMERVRKEMSENGAEVIMISDIPGLLELNKKPWYASSTMSFEFKPALNKYLSTVEPHLPVHHLTDVICFNQQNAEQCLKYGQIHFIESQSRSGSLSESEYIEDRKADLKYSREMGIDWALGKYKVDALVFPASSVASIAAKAGYPSIAIPAGYLEGGEPFGISMTAGAWQEGLLIEIASGYESATHHRNDPECAKF